MKSFAFCVALVSCFVLMNVTAQALEQGDEQLRKELAELRAKVKALEAEVARLKGEADKNTAALPEQDRKWVRDLTTEFMNELMKGARYEFQVKQFVIKEWKFPIIEDPNVIVVNERSNGEKYKGPRRVAVRWLFDKYQIDSETVAPSKDEVVLRGKLTGTKADWAEEENFGSVGSRESNWAFTAITKGKLGPRTGTFSVRVVREPGTSRWAIAFLQVGVDEVQDSKK